MATLQADEWTENEIAVVRGNVSEVEISLEHSVWAGGTPSSRNVDHLTVAFLVRFARFYEERQVGVVKMHVCPANSESFVVAEETSVGEQGDTQRAQKNLQRCYNVVTALFHVATSRNQFATLQQRYSHNQNTTF